MTAIERGAEALEPWIEGGQWSDFRPEEWRGSRREAARAVFESIPEGALAETLKPLIHEAFWDAAGMDFGDAEDAKTATKFATAIKAHLLSEGGE